MLKNRFILSGLFLCIAAVSLHAGPAVFGESDDFFVFFDSHKSVAQQRPLNLEEAVELSQINGCDESLEDLREKINLKAKKLDHFMLYPAGMVPSLKTRAAVFFDHDNLYVYFNAKKRPGYRLKANEFDEVTTHIWHDDNFEIFIDPFASGSEYFQLIINPLGYIFDARCLEIREPDPAATDPSVTIVRTEVDTDWISNADVWVQELEDCWEAMVRIPFSSFELPGAPLHTVWGMNFSHANRDNEELSQWRVTPGAAGFHQPGKFGEVFFGDRSNDDVLSASFRAPLIGYGKNVLYLDVKNAPGVRWVDADLTVSISGGDEVFSAKRRFRAPSNRETTFEFKYEIPFGEALDFYVSADVRYRDDGIAFFNKRVSPGKIMSFGIDRDIFFSNVSSVPCRIHLELGEKELSRARLVFEAGNYKGYQRIAVKDIKGNVLRLGINSNLFSEGDNYIEASLISGDDVLAVKRHSLTMIAPPAF